MLETVPLSAIFLCYAPLALMIVGLLVFFALTDANARRDYLRVLDPRPEGERTPPPPPDEPITAEVPSGGVVTILPDDATPNTPS